MIALVCLLCLVIPDNNYESLYTIDTGQGAASLKSLWLHGSDPFNFTLENLSVS